MIHCDNVPDDNNYLVVCHLTTQAFSEAIQWCIAEIGFDSFHLSNQPARWTVEDMVYFAEHTYVAYEQRYFFFNDEADAILFKLRWG